MCQRVTCSSCGKPSYSGCGRHVESVLADVPAAERCHCRETKATKSSPPASESRAGGFWSAVFGGRNPQKGPS